jgi:hypothetical protein
MVLQSNGEYQCYTLEEPLEWAGKDPHEQVERARAFYQEYCKKWDDTLLPEGAQRESVPLLTELSELYPPPVGKSHTLSVRNGTLILTLELEKGGFQIPVWDKNNQQIIQEIRESPILMALGL